MSKRKKERMNERMSEWVSKRMNGWELHIALLRWNQRGKGKETQIDDDEWMVIASETKWHV